VLPEDVNFLHGAGDALKVKAGVEHTSV